MDLSPVRRAINTLHGWTVFMANNYTPGGSSQQQFSSQQAGQGTSYSNDSDAQGRRVRLRPKPAGAMQIYGSNGLLQPLRNTNGMVWPYQPTITYNQQVDYTSMDLVHVNQELYAYTRTNSLRLNVSGTFTVQNQQEGIYALAAIHFCRVVTKMYFGQNDPNAGTPPPVLLFDAYGQYMFNQLPVLVSSFTVDLPNDVDYVPVDLTNAQSYSPSQAASNLPGFSKVMSTPQLSSYTNTANSTLMVTRMFRNDLTGTNGYVWLPAVFNLTVDLIVQNTPRRLRQFDLARFTTGDLMKEGRWI